MNIKNSSVDSVDVELVLLPLESNPSSLLPSTDTGETVAAMLPLLLESSAETDMFLALVVKASAVCFAFFNNRFLCRLVTFAYSLLFELQASTENPTSSIALVFDIHFKLIESCLAGSLFIRSKSFAALLAIASSSLLSTGNPCCWQ